MATNPINLITRSATTLIVLATLAVANAASAVETKVVGAEGAVTFSQKNHPHPHAVKVGQRLNGGETIATAAGARAAIGFMAAADTPEAQSDVILIGPDTRVEIVPQSGADVSPMLVRVLNGSYRAVIRNGGERAHFAIEAGGRVINLEAADVAGTYAPQTDNARLMCRTGSAVMHAGKRKIKVASGMYRAVDRGRILGARKLKSTQWGEVADGCQIVSLDMTMPVPVIKTASTTPEGIRELIVSPDGVTKGGLLPTTQAALNPSPVSASELEYVRMKTSMGMIVLELDRTNAPISVENFLTYVDDGFYSGTIFHRVISNFMIQGGGFEAGMAKKQTRPGIKNEWQNGLKNVRGSIAMARLGNQADSGTSQFFINVVDNEGLDRPRDGSGYAVFGRVVAGLDVVDAIRNTATTTVGQFRDVPAQEVLVEWAERTTKEDALQ